MIKYTTLKFLIEHWHHEQYIVDALTNYYRYIEIGRGRVVIP
jgi:hypothetical protein